MNRQNIVRSNSTSFPNEWHNATKFGVNQVFLAVILASISGINPISVTLKNLRQSGARKLQILLLSKNVRWLSESGLTSITLDADSTIKSVYGNQEGAEKGYNTTKRGVNSYHPLLVFVSEMKLLNHTWFRTGAAYTANGVVEFLKEEQSSLPRNIRKVFFRANDILWQLSVFVYNISVMICQEKDKYKRQEHRSFIDWFISVPAKITRSRNQIELKMYEDHFYKDAWEELDRLVEAV